MTKEEHNKLLRRIEWAMSRALSDQHDCIVRVYFEPKKDAADE